MPALMPENPYTHNARPTVGGPTSQAGSHTADQIRRAAASLLSGEGLRAKVFRGVAIMGSGSTAEQAARFGRNMILTRLLAPNVFGTMAIVLSTTSVLHTIMDMGVKQSLIQHPNGSEARYVNAAWWLALGRAMVFSAILVAAAPFAARFYGNGELTPLLRFSVIGVILDSAISSRAYAAVKAMNFRKWATITNGGGICGVTLTVILSFFVRDVWALMIGSCCESAARCVLSYVVCPYLPSLRWEKQAFRDLLHFSKGLFGLSFLNLIFSRTDIFVLAKLFSPAALGLYTMAINLVQTPSSFIMSVISQTLFPALSRVQDDAERINRMLIRVSSMIVLVGLPAVISLVFSGGSFLGLVYGSRYSLAAGSMALAACVALVNLMNSQITTVFYARGLPQLHRRAVAVMAATMLVAIYPFTKWLGIAGGQAAALLAVVVGFGLQAERIRRITDLSLSRYAKGFVLAVLASSSVAAVGFGVKPFAALSRPIPNIATGILGCLMAYGLAFAIRLRGRAGGSRRVLRFEL